MRRFLSNSKGFTLLEILIVIVILAVLAGLAIPVYTAQVEKARAQEAIQSLEQIRGGMLRFFTTNNTYVGATIRANGAGAATTDIDVDPNNLLGGQNQIFDYTITAQAVGSFTVRATRIAGRIGATPAVPAGGPHTLTIDQAGTVTRGTIYQ